MTEPIHCIASNCSHPAAPDSPLCLNHRDELQKVEANILKDATRAIRLEVRQFERLSLEEPPLHSAEIAFRMAAPMKKVKALLKRFKDDRA
jgi:predicted amidophosphoribosyltransferase